MCDNPDLLRIHEHIVDAYHRAYQNSRLIQEDVAASLQLERSYLSRLMSYEPQKLIDLDRQEEFLTMEEVATMMKVSVPVVRVMIERGMPYGQAGKQYRFLKSDVIDWWKQHNRHVLAFEILSIPKRTV